MNGERPLQQPLPEQSHPRPMTPASQAPEAAWHTQGNLATDLTGPISTEGVQQAAPSAYDESYLRQHEEARGRERAITSLQPGQKIAVRMPGRGNVLFTRLQDEAYQAGEEVHYRPAYDQVDLTPPSAASASPTDETRTLRPINPASVPQIREVAPLPPAHIGPITGVNFGPRGTQPAQEATPFAQPPRMNPRGGQPPEAHPNAGSDYVKVNDDLPDDNAFARPLESRRTPQREPQPESRQTQPVVEAGVPPVEGLNPKTIPEGDEDFSKESVLIRNPRDKRAYPRPQAYPAGEYGTSENLADRILRGEAEEVAEMKSEDRPDMTAVRRSGAQAGAAAAVEHAEKTGAAEQPSAAQPERRPRSADDDEEAPRLEEMLPGVVAQGQELDYNPGGGPPRYPR